MGRCHCALGLRGSRLRWGGGQHPSRARWLRLGLVLGSLGLVPSCAGVQGGTAARPSTAASPCPAAGFVWRADADMDVLLMLMLLVSS